VLDVPFWLWIAVIGGLLALMLADLLLVDHHPHAIRMKEAGAWAAVYIGAAIVFGIGIWLNAGGEAGVQYFTGYLLEESLSVDNLFVFVLIMSAFAVPVQHQHKVLLLGVIGALLFRGVFIAAGVALLEAIHWIIYVFGAFLVFTAIRLARHADEEPDVSRNPFLRIAERFFPVSRDYHESGKLTVRLDGRRALTPMALVMVAVATTDVMFAVDSIPAVFGVTRDPFIVFTSNAFALVGLRSLYFLLAGAVRKLVFLNVGLSVILGFVGVKMLAESVVHVPVWASLLVIVTVLTVTVVASLRHAARFPREQLGHDLEATPS
jgi:tellurite resistance protein TerC